MVTFDLELWTLDYLFRFSTFDFGLFFPTLDLGLSSLDIETGEKANVEM